MRMERIRDAGLFRESEAALSLFLQRLDEAKAKRHSRFETLWLPVQEDPEPSLRKRRKKAPNGDLVVIHDDNDHCTKVQAIGYAEISL